ncbi:Uncharacterised protein [Mycobacterium tuberculosis]|uniref:Uncharacterized protein n=1 Tax=Mycobacterium tuberculosis TaxID=1773 RepID=A0A916L8D9_MYCTX|nr:Uncharacterised protein [Mycobacterium tuberculosis]
MKVADHAEQFGTVGVQQRSGGHQIGGCARKIRPASSKNVFTGVARTRSRQQRGIQIALLAGQCARSGQCVLQKGPQIRRSIDIDLTEIRQPPNIIAELRQPRI